MAEDPKTRLREFAEGVHATLPTEIVCLVHRDDASKHSVKRRILWMTPGGSVEMPKTAGGRMPDDGGQQRIVACRDRHEDVDVSLYGESQFDVEHLLDMIIGALCENEGPNIRIQSYKYDTEEKEKSGVSVRTAKCTLRIRVLFPVSQETKKLRAITGIDHECGTLQDDGSITPEPTE